MQHSNELTVNAGQKECACPQCKQLVLVTPGHFKQVMGCPRCNHQFQLVRARVNLGRVLTFAVVAGLGALAIAPQVPLAITGTAAAVFGLALLVQRMPRGNAAMAHGLHQLKANWRKVAGAAALAVLIGLAWRDHRAEQAAEQAQRVARIAALQHTSETTAENARKLQETIAKAAEAHAKQQSKDAQERVRLASEQKAVDLERNRLMEQANREAVVAERLRVNAEQWKAWHAANAERARVAAAWQTEQNRVQAEQNTERFQQQNLANQQQSLDNQQQSMAMQREQQRQWNIAENNRIAAYNQWLYNQQVEEHNRAVAARWRMINGR